MKEIEENTLHIGYTSFGLASEIINDKLIVYKSSYGIESEYKKYITTKNNTRFEFRVKYGIYWNQCDELASIGEKIAGKLLESEIIKGNTYVQMMSAEYKVPIEFLDSKYYGPMAECEYKVLKGRELEEKRKEYLHYIKDDISNNYNNLIFVVKDEPRYSNSKKNHSTINIIIISKDTSYLIKVAYQNYKEFDTKPEQIVKRLVLKK